MKSPKLQEQSREQMLNIFMTSLTGAALGLLYAYGFEFSIALGILTGAAFGAAIGFRISRKPLKMRYPMFMLRRTLLAATFLLVASFGFSYLLDQQISQAQRYWIVLLPLGGWSAVIISIGMAIGSMDELQRRIQTEAIAIGFAVTAIFVGGYALFQFAGLSDVNVGLVLFVMSAAWLAGKLWTLWRYR
jgi:uncharacterized membrane protein YfcA